jgi:DMSO/TMAO reductase YedYZ molybdopterin-dependent catalytic subunit
MGFFDRNRRQLEERGVDPARLPPGQYLTDRFPVLHVGDVPRYDVAATATVAPARGRIAWDLRVFGLVGHELQLSWDELRALPATTLTTDIHCVTKWSKFDTTWTGVRFRDLLSAAGGAAPGARFVVGHAEYGYTANLPLEELLGDDVLVAYAYEGEDLEPQHGYPVRLVVPQRYFWKSVKWLRGIELVAEDRPGFWERNGYHNEGDPFLEQRFWGD